MPLGRWTEGEYCPACRRDTIIEDDCMRGEVVCTECGLVLLHGMEYTPSQPITRCAVLITPHARAGAPAASSSGAATRVAFVVENMCHALDLFNYVKDRVLEVHKKVEDSKIFARKDNRDRILAACVFVACRLEHCPRTLKEIMLAAPGTKKKQLGRDIKSIQRLLSKMGYTEDWEEATKPAEFLERFSSDLRLNEELTEAAKQALDELLMRMHHEIRFPCGWCTPASFTAGLLYMMTQLSDPKPSREDIALATGVPENAIVTVYGSLYSRLPGFMPFGTKEELKKLLPQPWKMEFKSYPAESTSMNLSPCLD